MTTCGTSKMLTWHVVCLASSQLQRLPRELHLAKVVASSGLTMCSVRERRAPYFSALTSGWPCTTVNTMKMPEWSAQVSQCDNLSLSLPLPLINFISSPPPDLAVCPSFDMSHGDYVVSQNISDRWDQGTQLDITCDQGFRLPSGSTHVQCSDSGAWDPESPECKRK